MNRRVTFALGIAGIIVLASLMLLQSTGGEKTVIVTGGGNPGKVSIYHFDRANYERVEIDTGYNLVWTVRIGDIYNNGKNVIVAGVGNSFFGRPFGCSVIAYEPVNGGWKRDVIDSDVDLRCKDIAIGSAYNDGQNELVLGTHGEGFINVYKWNGTGWSKQTVDTNFVSQVDAQQGANHRVPFSNLTYPTIVQTAVHIVKIGDVDNDGKNELVATESSPLEYSGSPVSFVNVYKFYRVGWNRTTVHAGKGVQDRSILIGDVDYSGKNKIVIGATPGKMFLLGYDGTWSSDLIFSQTYDKNMKGLDMQDIYSDGRSEIVLATGIPNALIYSLHWDGREFQSSMIGNVTDALSQYDVIKGLGYNSLDVQAKDTDGDGAPEIIVAGEADTSLGGNAFVPRDGVFGWETTPYGFLIVYKFDGTGWVPKILEQGSTLGMTVGKLQIS